MNRGDGFEGRAMKLSLVSFETKPYPVEKRAGRLWSVRKAIR
jgi:hypothetical protein